MSLLRETNVSRKISGVNGTELIELELELPASIPKEEARLMLAVKLYEKGRLTLGQAARTASYSKRAFIDLLGLEGVSILDSDPEELAPETGW
jgi:predicted HTH domain antitoxin